MPETGVDSTNTYLGEHIYLTVADEDENQVLELVRVDGPNMYVRANRAWVDINPEEDNPNVWDRQIIDVSSGAADIFDQAEESGQPITADLFTDVLVPEEAAA